MLQLKNITKEYKVGDITQKALDNVSVNFRQNEFVAILGTSGAGKTTLLNIIGGLDRYDNGDLIINNVSTKKYKDKDWDSYRNHTIGFIFQSYNLIPHQTILSNVELALTISGISKKERTKRAKEALEQVGLKEHINKKPNQLSGGQMQRVAIARALINNPSILLADEPTGALDSETSVQVMDMLKEVANDRLVIMVTHNPELAETYANRIVRVKDGKIIDDTNPFNPENEVIPIEKNMGKSSMSYFTSLGLSFNNLKTKKARTFLTAFAGSIGIIGIAMILSFSNGVNKYIADMQKETMTSYPITIEQTSFDLSSMIQSNPDSNEDDEVIHEKEGVYSNPNSLNLSSNIMTSIVQNNLTDFKKYLDNKDNEINNYIGENGVSYSYDLKFDLFSYDENNIIINSNGSNLEKSKLESMRDNSMGLMTETNYNNICSEILPDKDGLCSNAIKEQYEIVAGKYPENYNEMVVVLDKNNEIDIVSLYKMGILPSSEYKKIIDKINNEEKINIESTKIDIDKILNQEFYLIPECDYYEKNGNLFVKNDEINDKLLEKAIKIKISGIIKPSENNKNNLIKSDIGYTKLLTNYLINYVDNSDVVKYQKENKNMNILNGFSFDAKDAAAKIKDAKQYLNNMTADEKIKLVQSASTQMPQMEMSEDMMLASFENYIKTISDDNLLEMYEKFVSAGSYNNNMKLFGVIDENSPSSINIYVDSFEDKEKINDCIKEYNKSLPEEQQIKYNDIIGIMLSSVTSIINVISYVLIAFVAVSLVVSSIMIGIITYISVLERTKEIGILRAIGASKRNISQVFKAETFIIGFLSGIIGIVTTLILLIPCNQLIHNLTGYDNINANLPVSSAIILILLSIILTLIGGIIPAKKASKQNPVNALRSE